jgi:feruloyl esterase
VAIIERAYGRAPERFYFIGGSQGGHEALDAAARYPQDYDGVVAHFPAYNVTMLHLGSLNVGKALYGNGGAGWLSPARTKTIPDAVAAACDTLDGNPNAKRTRPLCEYPMWPKFTGAPGTENSAASFTCVAR